MKSNRSITEPPSAETMNNARINALFFARADAKTKATVLASIATHYGISDEEALSEVTNDDAEHLLDYLTGSVRAAVSVLMQGYGLRE